MGIQILKIYLELKFSERLSSGEAILKGTIH